MKHGLVFEAGAPAAAAHSQAGAGHFGGSRWVYATRRADLPLAAGRVPPQPEKKDEPLSIGAGLVRR